VLRDPRGDVYRVVRTPRSQTRLRVPTLDVTRATVSHLRQRVSIVVSLAEASSLAGTDLDLDLRTPAGRYFLTVALPAGPSRFVTPTADGLRCRGAGTTVDRAAGAVRITVPRSCLDDPDWVSVRVLLSRTTRTGELVENPHNSRSFSAYGTERLYPY
jgi:hypothetical protein